MMMTLAMSLLMMARPIPPSPTPGPEASPTPAAGVVTEIHVMRSRVGKERAKYSKELACTEVPLELFHRERELYPKGLPPGSRIAGNGRILGILTPDPPRGWNLELVRNDKVVDRVFLRAPDNGILGASPTLTLGDEGDEVGLRARESFAIYSDGTLTWVVSGDTARSAQIAFSGFQVTWCPWPRRPFSWFPEPPTPLYPPGEEAPLWLRAELDGSEEKALLRVDPSELDASYPSPDERALGIAVRSDGKTWLVGLASGEVMLATKSDRISERWPIPYLLRSGESDPKVMAAAVADTRKQVEAEDAARFGDATTKQPLSSTVTLRGAIRIIGGVFAHDRDLVLTTMSIEPTNALLVIPDAEQEVYCFTFPQSLRSADGTLAVAVTNDRLWFFNPFGYVPWDDLSAIIQAQKDEAEQARKAAEDARSAAKRGEAAPAPPKH